MSVKDAPDRYVPSAADEQAVADEISSVLDVAKAATRLGAFVRLGFDRDGDEHVLTLKVDAPMVVEEVGTGKVQNARNFDPLTEVWRGAWDPKLPAMITVLRRAGVDFEDGAGWQYAALVRAPRSE